jgi:hypothetical protein
VGDDYPNDWTRKVAFMRAMGASRATFHGELLVSVELGETPRSGSEETKETQPSINSQKREQTSREERRRVALRASGGFLPRLGGDRDQ